MLAQGILQSTLQITLMILRRSKSSDSSSEDESGTTLNGIKMDQQILERIQGFLNTAHALQEVAEGTLQLVSRHISHKGLANCSSFQNYLSIGKLTC